MKQTNFERMIDLAVTTFAAHNDPDQLDVDEKIIAQLQRLHPATLSEHVEGDGPVVWILLIPTTDELMREFVAGKISENELLDKTPLDIKYDALYLCSGLVLPEFRRKGLALKVGMEAIANIRADHPIKTLFTWNFSKQGAMLAEKVAQLEGLPLMERKRNLAAN